MQKGLVVSTYIRDYLVKTNNFIQSPQNLVIVINRFLQLDGRVVKNRSHVQFHTNITEIFGSYQLLGVIHHHGTSLNSGHYTNTIYINDMFYSCNDHKIAPSECIQDSGSAYIVFYRKLNNYIT